MNKKKKRDTCKPERKESVKREIKILQCIKCSDKSHIPYELQYQDRGYMYFPSEDFLPFLKEVDACVLENANKMLYKDMAPSLWKSQHIN